MRLGYMRRDPRVGADRARQWRGRLVPAREPPRPRRLDRRRRLARGHRPARAPLHRAAVPHARPHASRARGSSRPLARVAFLRRSTCCTSARERVIGVLPARDGGRARRCSTAGPRPDVPALKRGSPSAGSRSRDIRHLLLSHIHLDHAGAAGVLVREHPASRCTCRRSARRTSSTRPARASARRLYGDEFDTLWGELAPVPRGERPRSRRPTCSGSSASRRRATPRTTSATSTATARSTRATRPACASSPRGSSSRPRRRRRSTSRPGTRRSTRSSAASPSGSR